MGSVFIGKSESPGKKSCPPSSRKLRSGAFGHSFTRQRCAEDLLCVRTYCVPGTVLGAQGEGEARSLPRGLSRSSKPGIL